MAIRGNLRDMHLTDIIQMTCRNRDDAQVSLSLDGQNGEIYISDGQVVHANYGQEQGEEAVFEMLKWPEGQFVIEKNIPSPTTTIHAPWDSLLLRGMQYIDEARAPNTNNNIPDQNDYNEDMPPMGLTDESFDYSNLDGLDEIMPGAEPSQTGDIAVFEILQELADELSGLVAAQVVRDDEQEIASLITGLDPDFNENVVTSLGDVVRQANQSLSVMNAGQFQETITLTTRYQYVIRPVGQNRYYIRAILSQGGNIGAARMHLEDKEEALINTLLSN